MAIMMRRICYKYTKCIVASVLIAFFAQLLIAVSFFPSLDNNLLKKNGYESLARHEAADVSARKSSIGLSDDEDFPLNRQQNKPLDLLRVEELDFKPVCEIYSREAISAIHRAKTQICKQQIVNKTCLIQEGHFYPVKLPNYCPHNGVTYGKHLGCYVDEKKVRLLSGFYGNYASTNSHTACLDICIQGGFQYAGVQYGSECFCGESLPPASSKVSDDLCDMKCPANSAETCGGYFTMNVIETGVAKFEPRTPVITKNTEGEEVRIVFLLTLNGRALRQVHRLINSLYRSNHYFYIHVDSRQDYLQRELSGLEKRFPNIKLASSRYSTIWGGASLLTMLLASMKDILALDWQWDFVINLSESDFPIKSLESLEQFLSANKGFNFVKSHGREVQRFIKKQGLDKTFVECETHMWRIGERKLPKGIIIDGGSDWIALSPQLVKYVVGKDDHLLKGLDIVFQHTLLPAESYFHTVLRNSRFCNTYIDNNLHVTNWKRKLGCKCQYKHVVDWCGCSPNDFKPEDWSRIQNTQDRQLFFARKFEPIINQEIINRVELYIGFKDHYLINNLESYWQSIYNINDLTSSTDDTLLTHAESITRHNAKILFVGECIVVPQKIIEISLYSHADVYKGNLILHKALLDNKREITIETWYKPKKFVDWHFNSSYREKIQIFRVSSDYDQKEIIFRNYANVLGPMSEPVLLCQFAATTDKKSENFTVMWLDPTGVTADVNGIHVDENNLTNFIKPNIKAPLLPGVWKVGLFELNDLIVSTKFLITPLEYLSGNELSHQEASIIHGGSQPSYKKYYFYGQNNFTPNAEESIKLQKLSTSNVKRIHLDLREWVDSLTIEFYNVLGLCVTESSNFAENLECGNHKFDICESTQWSSLSLDPKGQVGKINKETGRLDRI